ncbi:hypothetical protein [Hyalangium versicolor]|uniref:hypothetical protein n=1 Tax=Hyalangium versicolor TaxID=2861190 RepID=UPI001CCDA906|nr:hypothetical protein [Hyalangium versicolor]
MALRLLRRLVLGVLAFALLIAGVIAWRAITIIRERDQRVAELQAELPKLRAAETLSPLDACHLAEAHYLESKHALFTGCGDVSLEPRNPGVLKFHGLQLRQSWKHALLGSGYVLTLCLAKGPQGWSVAGGADELADCQFETLTGDQTPQEQITQAQRSRMEAMYAAVKEALAGPEPAEDVCPGIHSTREVEAMDAELLILGATHPARDKRRIRFGDLVYRSCFPPPGERPWMPCGQAHTQPVAYAIVFDDVQEEEPVETEKNRFEGGLYTATVKLVDVQQHVVLCQRDFTYTLPSEVMTTRHEGLQQRFREGVHQELRKSVSALTQGQLVPPF